MELVRGTCLAEVVINGVCNWHPSECIELLVFSWFPTKLSNMVMKLMQI